MSLSTIRIATRQSPLALWQGKHIKKLLLNKKPSLCIELLPLVTSGDKFIKDKLLAVGGKGLFVKELEEALLNHKADIAVHSTKDMPATLPPGLQITAICKRDNPLDAFISNHFTSLDSLPLNTIIGTASLRRQSQLLAYRPDLIMKTLRGNIQTRLAKLDTGEYGAIVLAASGLIRMDLTHRITQLLPEELMLPTCGQGALCIESRTHDGIINELVLSLNDPISALCVQTERLVNAQLGGNCHVPLAVFCKPTSNNQLHLRAKILSLDGKTCIAYEQTGPQEQAEQLAKQCSEMLLSKGAHPLMCQSVQ